MKKQNPKTYLKLGILLFSIFTFVIACQKDDNLNKDEQNTSNKAPVIKTISYQQATQTFNKLKKYLKIEKYLKSAQTYGLSKTTTDTLGVTVYTDIIKEVTLGDYKSYTMRMVIPEADSTKFYNLTIEEKNGQSNMFVAEYTPTKQWLDNQSQTYQGRIKIQHMPEDDNNAGGYTTIPTLGVGVGGVGGNYSTDYPYDCIGTVVATTEYVPYMCGCGDWPTDSCSGCSSPPYYPGYDQVIHYTCEENYDTGANPYEGNPNTGGGGGSSTGIGNGNSLNNSSITVVVGPDEDCELPEEDKPFDLDEDCSLSPAEVCKKNEYRDIICNCVSEGNSIAECQEKDDCLELNALSNDTEFISIMNDLDTKSTTVSKEVGYIQKVDETSTSGYAYDYVEEQNINDEINFTIPSGTTLKGFSHTHDDVTKHSPVFSLDDLYIVFAFFNPTFQTDNSTCLFNNTFNIEEDFTMILITAHGTKLALKFNSNGREQLRQFGEKYFGDWNINTSNMPQIPGVTPETDRKIVKKKFDRIVDKELTIEKQKKKFAKFLDQMDFGMALYQANDDFTQWEKINKSGDPIPCN